MNTTLLILIWPVLGSVLGVIYALWRFDEMRKIVLWQAVISLGFIVGIILGPFTILLFVAAYKRDVRGARNVS